MQTPPQQEKPETLSAKQQNTFKKFTGDSKGFQLPTNLPNKAPVVLFEWDMGDPERLEQNPKFDDDNVESPLRWVGSFEAHLGYEPGEFEHTFEAWVRVLHPEDRQRVLDAIERHLQDGEPFCEVCRARRSDGSWFQFAHSGVATRDAAGTPWKYTGTLSNFVEMETDPTEDQTLIPQHKHLEQLRAESLLRTASYLNAQLDLKQVCEAICEEAARTIGAPSAVMLFNKSRDAFVPAAVRDMPKDYDKRYTPTIRSIYEKHVSEMGPLFLFRDAQATPDLPNHKLYLEVDMRTIGIASLIREGEVLGLLKVYSFGESRTFDENELALLQGLADLGAQAISNARFFTESQRRLARIQSLRQIDMAILGSNDVHVSLNVVLDQVVSQLDCNAASILLFNSHSRTLDYSAGRGFHTGTGQRSPIRMGEGLAGRCALERRLIYVPDLNAPEAFADASDDSIWPFSTLDQPDCDLPDGGLFAFASSATMNQLQAGLLPREGFVSYYVVPLVAGGQVKGVLELWHRSSLRLEEEEVDFLETLAGQAAISIDNAHLFRDLQRSNDNLMLAYDSTLEGWSGALDLRDKETEGHSRRVTIESIKLATHMGLDDKQLLQIRRGALLHDIGKMGIPDAILLKPGPLTDEEWVIMKKHPVYAMELLASISYLRPALEIPFSHHEKWDGSGYPLGLRECQIPLPARIFAVIDVWDALCSDRPYRKGWPLQKVLKHIRAASGSHFDPSVVEAFLQMNPPIKEDQDNEA